MNEKKTIRPYGANVLCEMYDEGHVTPGGIIIPDTAHKRPNKARVIAAGRGQWVGARFVEVLVKPGDLVVVDAYKLRLVLADGALANAAGTPYAGPGDRFIIHADHIIGVIEAAADA